MPDLTLRRIYEDEDGTLGVLYAARGPFCVTLELPWKDNEPRVSCIPVGRYRVKRHISPKFGECWLITDVEGRSLILIHPANKRSELLGCIAVGESFAEFGALDGIGSSRDAFKELMAKQRGVDEWWLTIEDARPAVARAA